MVCHPGTMLMAKSKLTTVCTETTSGVAKPPNSRYAIAYRDQCRAAPRPPSAKTGGRVGTRVNHQPALELMLDVEIGVWAG